MISPFWRVFLALYLLGTCLMVRAVIVGYSPKGLFEVIAG